MAGACRDTREREAIDARAVHLPLDRGALIELAAEIANDEAEGEQP
jgi:hypothetical protein